MNSAAKEFRGLELEKGLGWRVWSLESWVLEGFRFEGFWV